MPWARCGLPPTIVLGDVILMRMLLDCAWQQSERSPPASHREQLKPESCQRSSQQCVGLKTVSASRCYIYKPASHDALSARKECSEGNWPWTR